MKAKVIHSVVAGISFATGFFLGQSVVETVYDNTMKGNGKHAKTQWKSESTPVASEQNGTTEQDTNEPVRLSQEEQIASGR
jgi:hypothetical protein